MLSRSVISTIVAHDCLARVASVRCSGWEPEGSNCEWNLHHEDAAVGLCAHLAGAQGVESTPCFARAVGLEGCPRSHVLSLHPVKQPAVYLSQWDKLMRGGYSENASSAYYKWHTKLQGATAPLELRE